MTINEYQKLAMTTLNPELSKRDVLLNSVMGLCGESGEAIDIVKKHLHQGHPLDNQGVSEEFSSTADRCRGKTSGLGTSPSCPVSRATPGRLLSGSWCPSL